MAHLFHVAQCSGEGPLAHRRTRQRAQAGARLVQISNPLCCRVLYVACALLYFLALNRLPLSTAGPAFMVLRVVTTAILGPAVFGESLSFPKLLGIGICILGTVLTFCDTGW